VCVCVCVGGGEICAGLFSSFLLFRMRYMKYLMTFWSMFFMRVLMVDYGNIKLVILLMMCSCTAPLTPAVMVMRGLVCHPLFCRILFRGSYLLCLCVRAWSGCLSWQYVNLMSWIVSMGEGNIGNCVWFWVPILHRLLVNLRCIYR
jgi:hypothetical protein